MGKEETVRVGDLILPLCIMGTRCKGERNRSTSGHLSGMLVKSTSLLLPRYRGLFVVVSPAEASRAGVCLHGSLLTPTPKEQCPAQGRHQGLVYEHTNKRVKELMSQVLRDCHFSFFVAKSPWRPV